MQQVLTFVQQVLAVAVDIRSLLQGLVTQFNNQIVGANSPFNVLKHKIDQLTQNAPPGGIDWTTLVNNLTTILTMLQSAEYGLEESKAEIAAIQAWTVSPTINVNFPDTPPSWYTAPTTPPDVDAIAQAVWDFETGQQTVSGDFDTVHTTLAALVEAWYAQIWRYGTVGFPHPRNPYVNAVGSDLDNLTFYGMSWARWDETIPPPIPDWSLVLSTDTVLSFLQRTQPTWGWTDVGPWGGTGGRAVWAANGDYTRWPWWRANFTELDMFQLAALASSSPVTFPPMAPVWPGDDGVTYGTSTSLANGGTITEPMDGVRIAITSVDADHRKSYTYGGVDAYRNIGALAFFSDDGDLEGFQVLTFEQAIYTVKTMAHAAGVKWFVSHGASGTIRGWTVTP